MSRAYPSTHFGWVRQWMLKRRPKNCERGKGTLVGENGPQSSLWINLVPYETNCCYFRKEPWGLDKPQKLLINVNNNVRASLKPEESKFDTTAPLLWPWKQYLQNYWRNKTVKVMRGYNVAATNQLNLLLFNLEFKLIINMIL